MNDKPKGITVEINGNALPYIQKNEVIQKIIGVLKNSDKNISYFQAVDVLESTIEKLSGFSLFKN